MNQAIQLKVNNVNVLSLFDGLAGCRIALDRAGVPVESYYSSEIDKYASKVAKYNWPDIIEIGDMTKWRDWDVDFSKIDLLTAGFPCQAWSTAGKQHGDSDPRGALVHELIAIWKHIAELNPNLKFMFENVRMKKEFMDYINELFGVKPILINSALVSAQNRQRYYWTNIEGIEQPEDLGLVLANIIETGEVDREKSLSITTRVAGATAKRYLEKSMHHMIIDRPCKLKDFNKNAVCHHAADATDLGKFASPNRIYAITGKSPTVKTMQGGNLEPKILMESNGWRKLTPLECERLQTLPDNYTLVVDDNGKQLVSNSQRYKMVGNGWTIDVISHIFKGLK